MYIIYYIYNIVYEAQKSTFSGLSVRFLYGDVG